MIEEIYCTQEFLNNAVVVHDTLNGEYVVWLVDYDSQLATICSLYFYEREDWRSYRPPTTEAFLDFIMSRKPQPKYYISFWVYGLAHQQTEEAETVKQVLEKMRAFAKNRKISKPTLVTEDISRQIRLSWLP
jgi:hypothetical protein